MSATITTGLLAGGEPAGRKPEPAVLVLGMGATGASCARYFAARKIPVAFADTRPNPPGMASILEFMPEARLHLGSAMTDLPETIRRIVVSPGVEMGKDVVAKAHARGVEVVSDIDLFVAECHVPFIAITGSNGKSTVTSMVASMLSADGWSVAAGANLGTPALDLLGPDKDVYVLELSSFQLERSRALPAEVAVLLNISPDHLDRHGSMAEYAAAKQRVYQACRKAVVNLDATGLRDCVPADVPVTGFTLGNPGPGEFGLRTTADGAFLACGDTLLMPAAELPVAGRHNVANALAAYALGAALGADAFGMTPGLKHFRGMPHRMQTISKVRDATWIDDSKATNIGAAVTSIASVDDPLILIAGGDGKGADFSELAEALRGRNCSAILLGRDRDQIAEALRGICDVTTVNDMREAVRSALSIVQPGATVLLAPACASLDMFESFAHRGASFSAAVEALTQ